MLHHFTRSIAHIALPDKFTYPFHYTPHPLCVMAADEVQVYLQHQAQWQDELQQGKMFGVLIVQTTEGEIGYLAAFSGILAGKNIHPYFVPPIYDLLQPDGFFKKEEEHISAINHRIRELEEDTSYQKFDSRIIGNAPCSGHTECDAIIMDNAKISAIPEITANDLDASLIHEAAIGKIAGEQLIKLQTLGLTEAEAEEQIVNGFLK